MTTRNTWKEVVSMLAGTLLGAAVCMYCQTKRVNKVRCNAICKSYTNCTDVTDAKAVEPDGSHDHHADEELDRAIQTGISNILNYSGEPLKC